MRRRPSHEFLVTLLFLLPAAWAQPASHPATAGPLLAPFTYFSAIMSGGIVKEQPKKIYRSGDLVRIDLPGKFHVTSLRTKGTWAVHPDRCTYLPAPDVATYPFVSLRNYKIERSSTEETQMIDGHRCKLEDDTFTPTEEGFSVVHAKLWKAEDLAGFPLKIEVAPVNGQPFTFDYKSVSLERPDAKLFQVPKHCTPGPAPGH